MANQNRAWVQAQKKSWISVFLKDSTNLVEASLIEICSEAACISQNIPWGPGCDNGMGVVQVVVKYVIAHLWKCKGQALEGPLKAEAGAGLARALNAVSVCVRSSG